MQTKLSHQIASCAHGCVEYGDGWWLLSTAAAKSRSVCLICHLKHDTESCGSVAADDRKHKLIRLREAGFL